MIRRPGKWLFGGVTLVLLGTAVVGVASLANAYDAATGLEAEATHAADALQAGDLTAVRSSLAAAVGHLQVASSELDSVPVRLLGWLPFADNEVGAARAAIEAGAEVVAVGQALFDYEGSAPAFADGSFNPQLLDHLTATLPAAAVRLRTAADIIATAPQPRLSRLAGPMDELRAVVTAGNDALPGAAALAEAVANATPGDPFEVLILFENGAELRATGGLVGFTALMKVADGHLTLDDARVVHDPTGARWRRRADPGPGRRGL